MHFRDTYRLWFWTMLSTKYRLELTDICCRMLTDDGVPVSLEERIYLNKLSSVSALVSEWTKTALGAEASSIDND